MRLLRNITVKFRAGAGVAQAADEIVSLANMTDTIVSGDFNGSLLTASPGQTPETVLDLWNTAFAARVREFDRRTEESRLERIERKLDWLRDYTQGSQAPPWPGDTLPPVTVPQETQRRTEP